MRTQEELIQLQEDLRNGEYDGEHFDVACSLVEQLLVEHDAAPRPQVQWFSGEMERVLKENDHKGGWDGMDLLCLLNRLKEETAELADALEADDVSVTIKEAIDVANFAMMIADNTRTDR